MTQIAHHDSNPPKDPKNRSEHRERAFIAASHRRDRSIEDRMNSAYKASDIHFERTGKRLIITRDKVEGEEMYEEEKLPSKKYVPKSALKKEKENSNGG